MKHRITIDGGAEHPCRTCRHMHMPHERSQATGEMFLCKCMLKRCDSADPPEGPWGWSEFLDNECPYGSWERRRE